MTAYAPMTINQKEAVAELRAVFDRYEHALMANDVALLDELFWDSPFTVRYGLDEEHYGADDIRRFRASATPPNDLARELTRVVVTTYGDAFGTVSCEFQRRATGRRGRQMQTWMRTPTGWRVVAAHVSLCAAS